MTSEGSEGGGGRRQWVGLAFSGGGMRSTSFNLGLLQGLAELGILPYVDYLSTAPTVDFFSLHWSEWQSVN